MTSLLSSLWQLYVASFGDRVRYSRVVGARRSRQAARSTCQRTPSRSASNLRPQRATSLSTFGELFAEVPQVFPTIGGASLRVFVRSSSTAWTPSHSFRKERHSDPAYELCTYSCTFIDLGVLRDLGTEVCVGVRIRRRFLYSFCCSSSTPFEGLVCEHVSTGWPQAHMC